MNLNKVFILGRVTADPQLRNTSGGQPVTTLGVATNRTWTDRAEKKQEEVEFHNVVIWGKQAEVAATFLAKGSLVMIEGRLATRSWDDKDGITRKATEIVCENMQLGPKPGAATAPATRTATTINGERKAPAWNPKVEEIPSINLDEEEITLEDIPF
jgi:single-strand DNA-binding protein